MTEEQIVSSEVVVAVDATTAFKAFTEEMDLWWVRGPINFWSDGGRVVEVRCETGVGGRILEVLDDPTSGAVLERARITVWEPGVRLGWESDLDDVRTEVRFAGVGDETRVTVEHRIAAGGVDRGGTAWSRVVPNWFGAWCARRDQVPHELVDIARKVVGVGSVGTRCWIVLMLGKDDADPLFMQVKEAEPSVLEAHAGKSKYRNHGQRVVEGQRLLQAASDILLGWFRTPTPDGPIRDFYVRQLWDGKLSPDIDNMTPESLAIFAEMCGWTLARGHARSGDRIALSAYLGSGSGFDRAMGEFAMAYADQNDRDYQAMVAAVGGGATTAPPT